MGFVRWDNLFEQLASADSSAVTHQLTRHLARSRRAPSPPRRPWSGQLLVCHGGPHGGLTALSMSVPPTGWWSGPAVSFAGMQVTAGRARGPKSGSSVPMAPPPQLCLPDGVQAAARSQPLTGPLRADDLYSGDNLRLTFEARASWRRFLSHTLRRLSPLGQLNTAMRQVVLPGGQPHPARSFRGSSNSREGQERSHGRT